MAKQTFDVKGGSVVGRVVSMVVVIGVVMWFISSPTTAAEAVRGVFTWLGSAVDAVESFIQGLAA